MFLFHGLRRVELCGLQVGDLEQRRGVPHFRVKGKGGRFRLLRNRVSGQVDKPLHPESVRRDIVEHYAKQAEINLPGFCVHSLRATAATNALGNKADIAKVQEWLGHTNVNTTRLCDHKRSRPEDSPTFKVKN